MLVRIQLSVHSHGRDAWSRKFPVKKAPTMELTHVIFAEERHDVAEERHNVAEERHAI